MSIWLFWTWRYGFRGYWLKINRGGLIDMGVWGGGAGVDSRQEGGERGLF